MLNAAAAAAFASLLVTAARVLLAERSGPPGRRRHALRAFTAWAMAASFAAGLTQRDLWPFSKWPMAGGRADAAAATTRVRAVDAAGAEHDVDARAWEPMAAGDLVPWLHRTFAGLPPPAQREVASHLLGLAERGRLRARSGQRPGYLARWLGPLTAPGFNLHPRLWNSPAATPALPFVGLRIYGERWDQEERRRDPARVQRTLVYELGR